MHELGYESLNDVDDLLADGLLTYGHQWHNVASSS